jgi:hypothetical protein
VKGDTGIQLKDFKDVPFGTLKFLKICFIPMLLAQIPGRFAGKVIDWTG